jgi:hypothetical protein
VKLAEHVRSTDRKLCLSKEYIEWAKKAKRQERLERERCRWKFDGYDRDDYGEDEDMMADL